MRIVAICGAGIGTSGILKVNAERVLDRLGIIGSLIFEVGFLSERHIADDIDRRSTGRSGGADDLSAVIFANIRHRVVCPIDKRGFLVIGISQNHLQMRGIDNAEGIIERRGDAVAVVRPGMVVRGRHGHGALAGDLEPARTLLAR